MLKRTLIIVSLLSAFSLSQAQVKTAAHEWKSASSAGYTYRYVSGDPTATRFYTLSNGLSVILSPVHKKPRIQTLIAVKAGSKTDPSDHTGLAHYLEHMMFKGTEKFGSLDWAKEKPYLDKIDALYEQYNQSTDAEKRKTIYREIDQTSGEAAKYAIANEYDKMMAAIGSKNSNAFTSVEQTVYTEDIPANAVDQFLTIQAERFKDPVFRIFHTELEAVYEEKNRGLDNDMSKTWEALMAGLFPGNNYGRQTTIGTVEHLKNPSLKEIRKYYNNYYVPNNIGLIFAGDFNADDMIRKIDKHFSFMQKKAVPPYTFAPEKAISSPVEKEVWGPTPESLFMAYRFPAAASHEAQLLTVINSILSNGTAGLFDLNLNKKQRLLEAGSYTNIMKDYSMIYIHGKPLNGQSLEDVRKLILGEIEKLKSGQFDQDLLLSIVNNLRKDRSVEDLDYSTRANNIMDAFTSGVDWKTIVGNNERFGKVTKKDVTDFANKYFRNNYVIVYKKQGEDKSILKVEKPPITPVEVNRDAQSAFLKSIETMPVADVQPQWVDFKKDISTVNSGKYKMLTVANKDNSIFKLIYHYKMGEWNQKLLPVAIKYLDFLGDGKLDAEAISKEFYKLAGSFSISNSAEDTYVKLEGLQENFSKIVALYESLIRNCQANESALANLKESIKKDRQNAKLNKAAIMSGLMNYALYGKQNPFNYTLSDAELEALNSKQLLDVLHALPLFDHEILYWGPASAAQAAAGLASLHQAPASFKAVPAGMSFTKTDQEKSKVYFADFDMVQAEVRWVYNGDAYKPENAPQIELFNNYFGSGMGSIVFQTIRESKALAYSTNAVYSSPGRKNDRYSMMAYVGTQSDKFQDAVGGMNELLTTLPESEKVFNIAKTNVLKSLAGERTTDDQILIKYLNAQKLGLDYDINKVIYAEVPALQFGNVNNFFTANIHSKPYSYCVVASEKRLPEEVLKKYGELQKLSLREIFGY